MKRKPQKTRSQSIAGRSTLSSPSSPGDGVYTKHLRIANASLDELARIPDIATAGRLVRLQLRDELRTRQTSVNYRALDGSIIDVASLAKKYPTLKRDTLRKRLESLRRDPTKFMIMEEHKGRLPRYFYSAPHACAIAEKMVEEQRGEVGSPPLTFTAHRKEGAA